MRRRRSTAHEKGYTQSGENERADLLALRAWLLLIASLLNSAATIVAKPLSNGLVCVGRK